MDDAHRYDSQVDLANPNTSHTQLVLLTGADKNVLEVGPATGYVSRILQDRGCRVTGIEIDPTAAEEAKQYCERMIVGDIQTLDLLDTFGDERFDVVMFGDVLEHLVDPQSVLKEIRKILAPDGIIVASIPNVAHGSIRLALLHGQFRYTELGLLDRTHLRFFNRQSIEELFRGAGYQIDTWKLIQADPFRTELELRREDYPPYLRDSIKDDPEAMIYQFVVTARPAPAATATTDGSATAEQNGVALQGLWQVDKDLHELSDELKSAKATTKRLQRQLDQKQDELRRTTAALYTSQEQVSTIMGTFGFRAVEKIRQGIDWIAPHGSRRRIPFMAAGRAGTIVLSEGWRSLLSKSLRVGRWAPTFKQTKAIDPSTTPLDRQYLAWLEEHSPTPSELRGMKKRVRSLTLQPTFSILMPTYNTEASWLQDAIESVKSQVYESWELCVVDDGSTKEETKTLLEKYARDPRIKVRYLKENSGISAASNEALAMATGEFIGLLDHDDELRADALYWVVRELNDQEDLDFIYTDEDKKDLDGVLGEPFFKPDWSPDLEMSVNYVTHFSVYRKEVVERVGGFRSDYDGSQDYDLVLRVSEITDRIAHIAKPLYSWRRVPGSTAANADAKTFATRAAKRALKDALKRRGHTGAVEDGIIEGRYRVRYGINGDQKVVIVIPTRNRLDMLRRCIDSIREKTTYENYEILVADNDSDDPEMLAYLKTSGVRVLPYPGEFNFAAINNAAARAASDADAILFLNNDTEVITPGWLESMLEHAQRPDVAAVGARLLYPDGRVQHEGIIMGLAGGSAGNVDHGGYFGLGETVRNCSAVTAACMMVRPQAFWEIDGFDERLRVAFNDVDFCLRAREKGHQIVYTPHAQLYHFESASRGNLHPAEDEQLFRDRYGNPGQYQDPYYNPNFDILRPFTLRA